MRALVCLAITTSYGAAEAQREVPQVRIAIANGDMVSIVRTTDDGLAIERSVATPARVRQVAWVGVEPVVWLDGDELGTITPRGYAKLSAAPPKIPLPLALPKVAPPTGMSAKTIQVGPDGTYLVQRGEIYAGVSRYVLECTRGGRTRRTEDDRGYDDLRWVSRDPPMFQVQTWPEDALGPRTPAIFEGCTPSTSYTRAVAGPHELIVLLGSRVAVRWHDREIGSLATGGDGVAFEVR